MDSRLPSLSTVAAAMDSGKSPMSFEDLPYDVLLRIFALLGTEDIHVLRRASPLVYRLSAPLQFSWDGYYKHAEFLDEVYRDIYYAGVPGWCCSWNFKDDPCYYKNEIQYGDMRVKATGPHNRKERPPVTPVVDNGQYWPAESPFEFLARRRNGHLWHEAQEQDAHANWQ